MNNGGEQVALADQSSLEVRLANGMPYAAQLNAIIPLVNIPQFQPGAAVPVKISPTDPSQVALDVYGR